jgi:hypothetical protein
MKLLIVLLSLVSVSYCAVAVAKEHGRGGDVFVKPHGAGFADYKQPRVKF